MFHTQHQSRAHSPRNNQLSLTRSFSLFTTSLPTLSFPIFPREQARPGPRHTNPTTLGSGTSASLKSASHHTQQSTEGSAFLDRGLFDARHSTHARRSGLFFVLLSLPALSPSARHARESEGNANPPRGHPFPYSNSSKALTL
uniref:Uncharacterized protein n=1 Tax=Mesocestoides corti TaxID=53468 RepID=A0A5K3G0I4_MESCO